MKVNRRNIHVIPYLMAVVILIASVFTGCSADDEKEVSEVSTEKESTNEGVSEPLPDEAVNEGEHDGGVDLLDESGDDIPIIINGAEIQLGKMTAQEIADATGLPNTDKEKIVNVNSEEDVEFDTGNPMNFLTFHVTNYNSYSAEEAKDCLAIGVMYTVIGSKEKDELLSFAGITIGDTEEDIVEALGEPKSVSESDSSDYKELTYKFNRQLVIFTLMDGERINSIAVSLTIA